jgi:hypothetical protein
VQRPRGMTRLQLQPQQQVGGRGALGVEVKWHALPHVHKHQHCVTQLICHLVGGEAGMCNHNVVLLCCTRLHLMLGTLAKLWQASR